MKAIELYFNPKKERDTIFESFIFEPENVQEKIKGNLYIACEITNALPQNFDLLKNIAEVIKKEHYSNQEISFEQSFKNALKKANEFLNEKIENNNVSWLGNLNCAVLSVAPQENAQNRVINFTKYGDIKILLLKSESNTDNEASQDVEIIDISSNIETQRTDSNASKIFENIVAGKLEINDKIMLLTKNTFDFFKNENLIEEIGANNNEKEINKILKENKKNLLQTSGICIFIYSLISESSNMPKIGIPNIKLPNINIPKLNIPKIKLPFHRKKDTNQETSDKKYLQGLKLKSPIISGHRELFSFRKFFSPNRKKFIILIIILILTLSIGFLIFQRDKQQKITLEKNNLEQIELKITQAQNALIFKDQDRANLLLQQAWNEITPLTELEYLLREEAKEIKNTIEQNLAPLMKLENIANPEIVSKTENLFFQEKLSTFMDNFIILFSEPNELTILNPHTNNFSVEVKDNNIEKNLFLEDTEKNSIMLNMLSYNKHLYFLTENNQIIKYPYLGDLEWGKPESWLKIDEGNTVNLNAKSMAIDTSIWILNRDNKIKNYHNGIYKKTLELDVFPKMDNPLKIYTSAESLYLYILEPDKNRVIILTKEGKVFKQFQSEKFNNLKDFHISQDEKIIHLLNKSLNESLIYKINI